MSTAVKSKPQFSIGQRMYYVRGERRGGPSWVEITKIGRKWISAAYVDNKGKLYSELRFDHETLYVDNGGYSSPGRCYFTKEEYDAECLLNLAWSNFSSAIRNQYRLQENVTLDQIQAAAKVLGIDLKLETPEK